MKRNTVEMAKRIKARVSLDRAADHLDKVSDGTALLLKGHLLVEEALYAAIQTKCLHPEFILDANLGFAQLLTVAKALFFKEDEAALWNAIQALNWMRNRLAHDLEPPDMGSAFEGLTFGKWHPEKNALLNDPDTMIAVSMSIGMILGSISKLLPTAGP